VQGQNLRAFVQECFVRIKKRFKFRDLRVLKQKSRVVYFKIIMFLKELIEALAIRSSSSVGLLRLDYGFVRRKQT
jgi:hypothetical protein